MFLFNEQHQPLSIEDAKAQLASSANAAPTLSEVKAALGNYYEQALQLQGDRLEIKFSAAPLTAGIGHASFLSGIGGKILDEIKKLICPLLDGNSTEDEILTAILNALAIIIPGGVLIKALASIVIKYLLATGIAAFCGLPLAPVLQGGNQ